MSTKRSGFWLKQAMVSPNCSRSISGRAEILPGVVAMAQLYKDEAAQGRGADAERHCRTGWGLAGQGLAEAAIYYVHPGDAYSRGCSGAGISIKPHATETHWKQADFGDCHLIGPELPLMRARRKRLKDGGLRCFVNDGGVIMPAFANIVAGERANCQGYAPHPQGRSGLISGSSVLYAVSRRNLKRGCVRGPVAAWDAPPVFDSSWPAMIARLFTRLALLVCSGDVGCSSLVFAFLAAELLPGNTAQRILGQFSIVEQRQLFRQRLGLDKPPQVRYGEWLVRAARGDFGDFAGESTTCGLRLRFDRLRGTSTARRVRGGDLSRQAATHCSATPSGALSWTWRSIISISIATLSLVSPYLSLSLVRSSIILARHRAPYGSRRCPLFRRSTRPANFFELQPCPRLMLKLSSHGSPYAISHIAR